ncbi:MAG: SH3 domain-containing protein [Alphaproteobacteria bacterium]
MKRPRRFRTRAGLAALLAVLLAAGGAALGGDLPLPRFASLKADEVNLRAGPGTRYPVEWVFLRRGVPVEVTAEFEHWRKIRDVDGTEGWVHKSMISSRRSIVVTGAVRTLRRAPDAEAREMLRAEPGVQGRLVSCEGDWCRVEIADRKGWIRRDHIWGVYAHETVE